MLSLGTHPDELPQSAPCGTWILVAAATFECIPEVVIRSASDLESFPSNLIDVVANEP